MDVFDRQIRDLRGLKLAKFFVMCLALCAGYFGAVQFVYAQSVVVAETVRVADPEVAYGDLVMYDPETDLYRISQAANDPRFYGVVVEDPALLIETEDGQVPVARGGRVPLNVTLENGEIEPGDPLVSSSVLGKAMRATEGNLVSVFGFAVEGLSEGEGVIITDAEGEEVEMGTIAAEVGGERLRTYLSEGLGGQGSQESAGTDNFTNDTIKYGAAAIVSLASLFISFYTFLASVRQGVVSIGRNPRARAAIRSMVILNILLALTVSGVGIFFALSILSL